MSGDIENDRVVHLNVGGRSFAALYSTLTWPSNSMLAKMLPPTATTPSSSSSTTSSCTYAFSPPLTNAMGEIFIDQNPEYFEFILEFLRHRMILSLPLPRHIDQERLRQVASFFCLEDLMFPDGSILAGAEEDETLEYIVEEGAITPYNRGKQCFILGENEMLNLTSSRGTGKCMVEFQASWDDNAPSYVVADSNINLKNRAVAKKWAADVDYPINVSFSGTNVCVRVFWNTYYDDMTVKFNRTVKVKQSQLLSRSSNNSNSSGTHSASSSGLSHQSGSTQIVSRSNA